MGRFKKLKIVYILIGLIMVHGLSIPATADAACLSARCCCHGDGPMGPDRPMGASTIPCPLDPVPMACCPSGALPTNQPLAISSSGIIDPVERLQASLHPAAMVMSPLNREPDLGKFCSENPLHPPPVPLFLQHQILLH